MPSANKFLCHIACNFSRFFADRIAFNPHRCQPLSHGINTAVYVCMICIFNMTHSAWAENIYFDFHQVICSHAVAAKRVSVSSKNASVDEQHPLSETSEGQAPKECDHLGPELEPIIMIVQKMFFQHLLDDIWRRRWDSNPR